tara:strand:+ start:19341 stop:20051 length:711 start_codon:yes stop_codon:yes gene_type:complete
MRYFQLDDYTALRITGENVNEFLQGQISSDIYKSKHFKTLFCDEKGYIITNATIILDKDALIIIKSDIAKVLNDNLSKFSKFFKCRIQQEDIDIYGKILNGSLEKIIGTRENLTSYESWQREKLLNFDIDITEETSGKFRVNELGFSLDNYVSFNKGCFRGQEIIARINYLSKAITKPVVFESLPEDCIQKLNYEGKFIFKTIVNDVVYHQFMLKQDSVLLKDRAINQVASLWKNL